MTKRRPNKNLRSKKRIKFNKRIAKDVFTRVGAMALAAVLLFGVMNHDTEAVSKKLDSSVVSGLASNAGWGDATSDTGKNSGKKKSTTRKKTLTLSSAKKLAYSYSEKRENLEDKIEQNETAYANKVKAVDIKNRYIRSFHWKFLFSIELPRDPTLEELYESAAGPAEKLEDVKMAKNDLKDYKISLDNDVTTYYVEVYKGRSRIDFDEQRLLVAQDTADQIEAMVATGEKEDADLKEANAAVKELETTISTTQRATNSNAKKLAKLLGFTDETTGGATDPYLETYNLEAPYQTDVMDKLSRNDLPYLQSYTLEHDDSVYESRCSKSLAYVGVTTYYSAISRQMSSGDMNIIRPYVNDIIAGKQVNKRAFKSAYSSFLTAIDRYWEGKYKIGIWPLKFSFNKTAFKGKGDGQWYMQDNPNALLDASLDYMAACKDLEELEDDKRTEVEDSYNTYVGLMNALITVQEQEADAKDDYEDAKILYRTGELTAEEYNTILSNYESLQTQEMDALTAYSEQVSAMNRLTCGAIDKLMGGGDVDNENGAQMVVANQYPGPSYFIIPKYEDLTFEIGINVPDDYGITITDFELWCDNNQIGTRTEVGTNITHLMVATADVKEVKLRLYDGETFICDCEINPAEYQGPLDVVQYDADIAQSLVVGSYELDENTGDDTVTLKLIPDSNIPDNIKYFVLYDENGVAINSDELRETDEGVKYLSGLGDSLDSVTIKLYDIDQNYLYDATFDITGKNIVKKEQE